MRFFIGILIAFSFGCNQPNALTISEYIAFTQDENNGLIKKQKIGGFIFTAQLLPKTLIALGEQQNALNNFDYEKYTNDMSNQDGVVQIKIKMESDVSNIPFLKRNSSSQKEYQNRINHLNQKINNDLKLYHGQDTLSCKYTVYERMYNMTNYNTILSVFENIEPAQKDLKLEINGRFLNLGLLNFTFSGNDIKRIPRLKLEEYDRENQNK